MRLLAGFEPPLLQRKTSLRPTAFDLSPTHCVDDPANLKVPFKRDLFFDFWNRHIFRILTKTKQR